uniref:PHD finger protein 20, a n=1 Tax=Sinocyclocheilus anshuiensis TaxID=1608454 RepID=A0A671PCP0_9TELE
MLHLYFSTHFGLLSFYSFSHSHKQRRKKLTAKNGETPMLKKTEKDKNMQEENGISGAKQAVGQTDCVPEEEEDEISDLDREEGEQKKSNGNGTCLKVENISVKEENEERVLEQVGQHNYSKSFLKKVSGPAEGEEEPAVKLEDSLVFDSGMNFNEVMEKRNETEEAEVQVEQKKEEIKGQCLPHDRKSQRQRIRRKRRLSMARQSSKKSKTDSVYRVIRNQPPPVLSINLDHNPYKCGVPGCTKSFGKAKLLHYHMKYYHGDDRLIEPDQTRPMDKHTTLNNQDSSKKRCITSYECAQMSVKRRSLAPPVVSAQNYQRWPSLKDKTRENQLDSNMHRYFNKERERRFMEMEGVKERDRLKEKQTRDFLQIKLKEKKKIRKTTSDEDSISDRSSDSCGWSEDEMGVDLDIIASPLSCSSVASTTGSQETVRCVCEVEEENDFMLQCEECLYWQHGTCMGLLEENVPERYACFICWDSPGQIRGQRQRLRYWYDRDWLSTGHMYGLSFLENYSHKNGKKIAATHQLLGDVQHVVEVLNGLQLKISVLQSQSHRDLKLWRQPRKLTEKSRMKTMALPDTKTVSASTSLDAIQCKEPLTSPFQDYISSEHCYQKPQTLYQVLEPRLVLKTRVESVLEDRLHNTETMLKNDQHYNGEIQPALLKTPSTQLFNHSMDVGEKCEVGADGGGVKG